MSTSLLPGAADQLAGGRPAGMPATPVDHVHDHVVRLLGDPDTARQVTTDVVVRAADRGQRDAAARSLEQLLRSAHARMATTTRADTLDTDLAVLLGGGVDGGSELVATMAELPDDQAAVLDLTSRHGLDVASAARVLGLDRRAASSLLEEATAAARRGVAERGGALDLEIRRALRRLPLVPARPELVERWSTGTQRRAPVRPWLAWIATGVITLATFGTVASTLARAAEPGGDDAPVATAVPVDSGPAARELAEADTDRSPAEELVVRPTSTPRDDEQADVQPDPPTAPPPDATPSGGDAEPEPGPTADPTDGPTPTAAPTSPEEPSEQPTPPQEPSEDPSQEPTTEPSEAPSPSPSPSEPPLDVLPGS